MTAVTLPPIRRSSTPNESARARGSRVRLVVVHRPVGSYTGTLSWCRNPKAQVSYHVVIRPDGAEATQLVAWERKSWASAAFNSEADNICTPDRIWLEPWTPELAQVMRVCARVVALRLSKRGLPASNVADGRLLSGEGYTRHGALGRAGGGHPSCPVPSNDHSRWRTFRRMVAEEYTRGGFPNVWGRTRD